MPVYDFQCISCNEIDEDIFVHKMDDPVLCSTCKGETIRLFPRNSRFMAKTFPSEGIFLEHVSAKGETFYSESSMRAYAKKHDLELGATSLL